MASIQLTTARWPWKLREEERGGDGKRMAYKHQSRVEAVARGAGEAVREASDQQPGEIGGGSSGTSRGAARVRAKDQYPDP